MQAKTANNFFNSLFLSCIFFNFRWNWLIRLLMRGKRKHSYEYIKLCQFSLHDRRLLKFVACRYSQLSDSGFEFGFFQPGFNWWLWMTICQLVLFSFSFKLCGTFYDLLFYPFPSFALWKWNLNLQGLREQMFILNIDWSGSSFFDCTNMPNLPIVSSYTWIEISKI